MQGKRLESIVDPRAPLASRVRRRIAFATGLFIGGSTVAGLIISSWPAEQASPLVVPTSIVVNIEAPLPPPPPTPIIVPAPPEPIACPKLDRPDEPIGVAATDEVEQLTGEELGPQLEVVASAGTPHLAILSSGAVFASSDDGKTFRRAFEARTVDEIRIDRIGVLYARAEGALGIRTPAGAERWRDAAITPCSGDHGCGDRIVVTDDRVLWFRDGGAWVSRNKGASWRAVSTRDQLWGGEASSTLFAWRGAIYQVHHYQDRCGVDEYPTWRLDLASQAITHTVFHTYYPGEGDEPLAKLQASSDVEPTWTWRERCWKGEASTQIRCTTRNRARSAMLVAKTLLPIEGARTLAVYDGSLVEICGDRARQIYRRFPFDQVSAVDSVGRPLVARNGSVLRWSPTHGWRRLYKISSPCSQSPNACGE